MRYFFFVLYFSLCFYFHAYSVPPSPAGGGYFQIYSERDHTFVSNHENFDINLQKNGFTIEMWIYLKRPLKRLNRAAAQGTEKWNLIEKDNSYRLQFTNGTPNFTFTHPRIGDIALVPQGNVPLNEWHYIAVTLSNSYIQQAVNTQLWGTTLHGINDLLAFRTSESPLQIGGGGETIIGAILGPFDGKPVLTNFTGGLIDEIRISNIIRYPKKKLDQEAWRDTILVPTGPFEPDEHTVALWHFDFDGLPGSKWRDVSGNDHHLTYQGEYLGVEPNQKLSIIWGELKRRQHE